MSQIFHRSTNTFSRVTIFGAVFAVAGLLWLGYILARSPIATGVGATVPQPVQFSHEHHVYDDGIDCRYCHTSVEDSSFAGIPAVEVCMNCHSQLWTNSPALAPIIQSWETGVPIQWNRVNNVDDFVYFNHSIHVRGGIGCETCHGRIDQMPLVHKAETLQMEWCLECHSHPEKYVRPRDEVFTMGYEPEVSQSILGPQLVELHDLDPGKDCYVCHR